FCVGTTVSKLLGRSVAIALKSPGEGLKELYHAVAMVATREIVERRRPRERRSYYRANRFCKLSTCISTSRRASIAASAASMVVRQGRHPGRPLRGGLSHPYVRKIIATDRALGRISFGIRQSLSDPASGLATLLHALPSASDTHPPVGNLGRRT